MSSEPQPCILALDMGTSAFKSAAVGCAGLLTEPREVPYSLEHAGGRVTCPPERYVEVALQALKHAAEDARAAKCLPVAIGIGAQAQTFLALDTAGKPLADAVVWLDERGAAKAAEFSQAVPDVRALCGFPCFSGMQFMPKVAQMLANGDLDRRMVGKLLLLNEYVALRLTGRAYGDDTGQGMGGFYDISRRRWSAQVLELAGISQDLLANTAPAGAKGEPLTGEMQRRLNLGPIPVYLCGNDNGCAAAGVDLDEPGSVMCSFGTAMVLYARTKDLPRALKPNQIAGIDPLTSRYFVLGLESHLGQDVDALAARSFPGVGVDGMMERIAEIEPLRAPPDLLSAQRAVMAHVETFSKLLQGLDCSSPPVTPGGASAGGRLVAAGGLSRSQAWLQMLSAKVSRRLERAAHQHASLIGIARIIARNEERFSWNTASSA